MKKLLTMILGICFVVGVASESYAKNTPEEAEALVKKATELYKAKGKEALLAAISDPKGEYMKGELYAFVFDFNTVCLAHPANAKLIGKNLNDLKDAEGKQFMKDMTDQAKKGGGWTEYKWTNPETKKIQQKASYALPIAGTELYIGAGIYK